MSTTVLVLNTGHFSPLIFGGISCEQSKRCIEIPSIRIAWQNVVQTSYVRAWIRQYKGLEVVWFDRSVRRWSSEDSEYNFSPPIGRHFSRIFASCLQKKNNSVQIYEMCRLLRRKELKFKTNSVHSLRFQKLLVLS
jgi:hypothetical protein